MNTVSIDPEVKKRVCAIAQNNHGICFKSTIPADDRRAIYRTVQNGCLNDEEITEYFARKIKIQ